MFVELHPLRIIEIYFCVFDKSQIDPCLSHEQKHSIRDHPVFYLFKLTLCQFHRQVFQLIRSTEQHAQEIAVEVVEGTVNKQTLKVVMKDIQSMTGCYKGGSLNYRRNSFQPAELSLRNNALTENELTTLRS